MLNYKQYSSLHEKAIIGSLISMKIEKAGKGTGSDGLKHEFAAWADTVRDISFSDSKAEYTFKKSFVPLDEFLSNKPIAIKNLKKAVDDMVIALCNEAYSLFKNENEETKLFAFLYLFYLLHRNASGVVLPESELYKMFDNNYSVVQEWIKYCRNYDYLKVVVLPEGGDRGLAITQDGLMTVEKAIHNMATMPSPDSLPPPAGPVTYNVSVGQDATGVAVGPGATASHNIKITKSCNDIMENDEFQRDIVEILHAIVDSIKELESEMYSKLSSLFAEIRSLDVQGKSIADLEQMIEPIWLSHMGEEFKTTLQKLDGTKILEKIIGSALGTLAVGA